MTRQENCRDFQVGRALHAELWGPRRGWQSLWELQSSDEGSLVPAGTPVEIRCPGMWERLTWTPGTAA